MISLTVWLAASTLSNTPNIVLQASGARTNRTNAFVTTPNMPSLPMNAPRKS